jgi:hypothetical protein
MFFYSFILSVLSFVDAHIFMQSPPSRRNKYSSYYVENNLVDYNIMAPLETYGYTFPCKGFPKGPSTYIFDSNTVKVTLEGTAIHGGGHCQFGITYNDHDFLVLKTVIRSCLLDSMSYEFNLPTNTPSGDVTVFWTWVNAIGHREYYMECADVTVNNNVIYNNTPLIGKELIILDILGYTIIPEFPNPGMYDGREFLLNARSFSIYPSTTNIPQTTTINIPQTSTTNVPQTTTINRPQTITNTQITNIPTTTITSSNCISTGDMKCNGQGFDTCVYGKWIYRSCSPGTSCKNTQNSIICDFV